MVEKEFSKIISPDAEDRLQVRIATEKGKVINIVVQYEAITLIERKSRVPQLQGVRG